MASQGKGNSSTPQQTAPATESSATMRGGFTKKQSGKFRIPASWAGYDLGAIVGIVGSPFPKIQHWFPGINFNVEEWFEGDRYETLATCRSLALARAAFEVAVEEKPTGMFMIRNRTRVVKRHPEGDW